MLRGTLEELNLPTLLQMFEQEKKTGQLTITRTVDNYVAKLRTQLEPKPHDPRYLITVHW